jgi:hypothetical protein
MKRILDTSFRYTPSFDTDVRRTFERIKRQQRTKNVGQERTRLQPALNALPMELNKASGTT